MLLIIKIDRLFDYLNQEYFFSIFDHFIFVYKFINLSIMETKNRVK